MVFTKCCCCVDLRSGAIVIAIFEILLGLTHFRNIEDNIWASVIGAIVDSTAGACLLFGAIKYNQTTTIVYLVFFMIGIILYVIFAIMLLVFDGAAAIDDDVCDSA